MVYIMLNIVLCIMSCIMFFIVLCIIFCFVLCIMLSILLCIMLHHRFTIDSEFHCYNQCKPFILCSEFTIWRGVAAWDSKAPHSGCPKVFCEAQESGEKSREKQPKKGLTWSRKSRSSLVVSVSIGTVVWRSFWARWVLRHDFRTRLELGIIIQVR